MLKTLIVVALWAVTVLDGTLHPWADAAPSAVAAAAVPAAADYD